MNRYTIESEHIRKNFSSTSLTFLMDKVKSDELVMIRPFLKLYTADNTTITTKYGNWWVIGKYYEQKHCGFSITQNQLNRASFFSIGLVIDGVDSSNRLYFNHLQLSETDTLAYHQPAEAIPKTDIKFSNSFYANLYTDKSDSYLQVIRPYYNNMDTETIKKSKVTVLVPHLENEDNIDSPASIGLEFMNASDQKIEILR